MAIVCAAFTVATTPTLIAEIPEGNPSTAVQISNTDSAALFLGTNLVDHSTTANRGVRMNQSTNLQLWLNAGDKLYAISGAGTSTNAVSVLFSKIVG
jgi:hypothetical protein